MPPCGYKKVALGLHKKGLSCVPILRGFKDSILSFTKSPPFLLLPLYQLQVEQDRQTRWVIYRLQRLIVESSAGQEVISPATAASMTAAV